MSIADETWMRRALEPAERGRGFVEPNPLVGAVLVRDGRAVGDGWRQRFGRPMPLLHCPSRCSRALLATLDVV